MQLSCVCARLPSGKPFQLVNIGLIRQSYKIYTKYKHDIFTKSVWVDQQKSTNFNRLQVCRRPCKDAIGYGDEFIVTPAFPP